MVGEKERMLEVLQQWGRRRGEVRYRLRPTTRTHVDASAETCLQNGVRRGHRHGDGAARSGH